MPSRNEQMTFDDLRTEVNLNVLTPEQLYDLADASLLKELPEDSRLDRKSSKVQPRDLGDYFSMWSNVPNGGLIVVGQSDKGDLEGLSHLPTKRLNELELAGKEYCPESSFAAKRIAFTNAEGKGDFVLLIYVKYHPVKAVATSSGDYFIRLGDQKRLLKHEEVRQLRLDKGEVSVEREIQDIPYPKAFDTQAIHEFVQTFKVRRGLTDDHTTEDLLELSNLGKQTPDGFSPNLACVLLFAKNVTSIVAGCRIRFLRFEGETEGTGEKWNAVKDEYIDGTVPEQIRKCEAVLKSQLRSFSRLGAGGRFFTAPEYPEPAWYEAIVNACVHRSFSNGLANANIFVKMFDDRLEVESPGPFPPFVNSENIYDVHLPRNPHLMNALYFMDFVKCAHEGTRRIRQSMSDMGLPAPVFKQQKIGRALVRVTLKNNIKQRKVWVDSDVTGLVGRALVAELSEHQKRFINFVAENGSINVSDAQRLSGVSWGTAKKTLMQLVEAKIFEHVHDPGNERDPKAHFVLRNTALNPKR